MTTLKSCVYNSMRISGVGGVFTMWAQLHFREFLATNFHGVIGTLTSFKTSNLFLQHTVEKTF